MLAGPAGGALAVDIVGSRGTSTAVRARDKGAVVGDGGACGAGVAGPTAAGVAGYEVGAEAAVLAGIG